MFLTACHTTVPHPTTTSAGESMGAITAEIRVACAEDGRDCCRRGLCASLFRVWPSLAQHDGG